MAWENLKEKFLSAKPFSHVVVDNFFHSKVAEQLAKEFPSFDSADWYVHDNSIEVKKILNHWELFPTTTYQVMTYLNSNEFLSLLGKATGIEGLLCDHGLMGGGWHAHTRGGRVNLHKDYSLHPKLGKERRLNLIVYLTPDWNPDWGGELELWSNDSRQHQPLKKEAEVKNKFNRALLFDTTQNSWHGLPNPIRCPEGVVRKSLAVYYLTEPRKDVDPRGKALFAPREDQKNDPEVRELIRKRSDAKIMAEAYRQKKDKKE